MKQRAKAPPRRTMSEVIDRLATQTGTRADALEAVIDRAALSGCLLQLDEGYRPQVAGRSNAGTP